MENYLTNEDLPSIQKKFETLEIIVILVKCNHYQLQDYNNFLEEWVLFQSKLLNCSRRKARSYKATNTKTFRIPRRKMLHLGNLSTLLR